MKKIILLALLSSSLSFFGQKTEIIKVMTEQQTAWNNGEIDTYMEGYWKSDSLLFIGSKGPTYGWNTTLANYKKAYPTKDRMGTLVFSDIQVKPLGKKYAYVFGKWRLIRADDKPGGIYTLIFQKFKEGWKIISDHTQ